MNKYCFTLVHDGLTKWEDKFRVAKVIEDEVGYYPLGKKDPGDPTELDKFSGSYDDMLNVCEFMNSKLNLSEEEKDKIILSSMKLEKFLL
tara:strand:+ start:543 stop:812 length:270 start_codon:yes stop_codon:yes gene_type:complete